MSKVLILDTETTGVSATDQVIELAYLEVDDDILTNTTSFDKLLAWCTENIVVERYKPSVPINDRAFAVHGILLKSLLKCKPSSTCVLPEGTSLTVCHNSPFDMRMLKSDLPTVCTLSLARAINKKFKLDIGSFNLDNLIVHFYGDDARGALKEYHDASTDVFKTLLLLVKLIEYFPAIKTFEELHNIQKLLKGKK